MVCSGSLFLVLPNKGDIFVLLQVLHPIHLTPSVNGSALEGKNLLINELREVSYSEGMETILTELPLLTVHFW